MATAFSANWATATIVPPIIATYPATESNFGGRLRACKDVPKAAIEAPNTCIFLKNGGTALLKRTVASVKNCFMILGLINDPPVEAIVVGSYYRR